MAKRFNVSIPDALAERLEPHKDKISLSAVMQAALERELAQLTMGDQEKQRRDSFKAAAMSAWLKRNGYLAKALSLFIEKLFDEAANDGMTRFFGYYRHLYTSCRYKEIEEKLANDPRYRFFTSGADARSRVREMLRYTREDEFAEGFEGGMLDFAREKAMKGEYIIPQHFFHEENDDKEELTVYHDFYEILTSPPCQEAALAMMHERLRSMLSDEDIDTFVLDFEAAFAEIESDDFL